MPCSARRQKLQADGTSPAKLATPAGGCATNFNATGGVGSLRWSTSSCESSGLVIVADSSIECRSSRPHDGAGARCDSRPQLTLMTCQVCGSPTPSPLVSPGWSEAKRYSGKLLYITCLAPLSARVVSASVPLRPDSVGAVLLYSG